MDPMREHLSGSVILHRELFVLPCIAVPALSVWFCCFFSRENVIVDPLPPLVFLLNFAVLPWRENTNDLELIVIFFSVSFTAIYHLIRAIGKKHVDRSRRLLLRAGLTGQVIAILAFYSSNGARLVPIIPGDWAAGMKEFDVSQLKLGVESLKFIFMVLLLLDIGLLPGEFWQAVVVKAGQVWLLWVLYSFWVVEKPHSLDEPMMTMVWAALQKSKALDLVMTLRVISVVFNWTAFKLERHPSRVARSAPCSPARVIQSGTVLEPLRGSLHRRRVPARPLLPVVESHEPSLPDCVGPIASPGTVAQPAHHSFYSRSSVFVVSEVEQSTFS